MRIPTTTYRIQFHPGFDFEAGNEIITYLAELGITDVYASLFLKLEKVALTAMMSLTPIS